MKWIKPDTIIKKSIFQILGIGLIAAILIHLIMPNIFYDMLSPYITQHVTSMLQASTISQSYIWQGNRMAYLLYQNEELKEDIRRYTASGDAQIKSIYYDRILDRLGTQDFGNGTYQIPGEGAIISTSYSMICTEYGDVFCLEEAAPLASVLMDSDWLSNLTVGMTRTYSPVLGDASLQIICFVMPFEVDDMLCYSIHIMDFNYIHILFQELEAAGINDYCILQNDRILYQNTDHPFDFNSWPDYMFQQLQYKSSVLYLSNGMDFMTRCSYEEENMQIAVHADRNILLKPYQQTMQTIETILYLVIFLLIVIILLILRHLLGGLTILSQRIDRVTAGNYIPLPDDGHNDEIGRLTRNFNRMVNTIQSNIEQRISHEKKEQQMQYSLLVSAIDPHFIYNTLNTITFLAHMKKTDEIVKVNTALIGTLKDRLSIKNCKNYDTIETEREILEQYMLIQSYLCHNNIDYRFEIADENLKLMIPKNILQPLVENSIKHGLLPHKDPNTHQILDGQIIIQTVRKKSAVIIMITDNGVGISEEDIQKYFYHPLQDIIEKDEEHIGIYNIRKRLDHLLRNQYQLHVKNTTAGGCEITLVLPLIATE